NSFTTGQLCVTSNNTCGSSTARCINVKGAPANPGVISGPTTVCAAEQGLVYSVPAVFGASSYNWTLPAGATIVAGANTNSIVVDWGNASGSIIVSTTNGCGTSGARTLSVLVNCRVSGSEMPGAVVSAYPNPVSTKLNVDVQATTAGTYTLELSDLAGRIVLTDMIQATEGMNSVNLNVAELSKGVYMLSVKNAEGFAKQIRIAVE
ncbi:MAG: T9SS type A sorting domain-containing protein, partial [Bacteroidia bacterium]|nr:T9SS type A sorting domain-containing protein [Bacteroidia bacterium]